MQLRNYLYKICLYKEFYYVTQINNRSFLSGRVLRERTGYQKIERIEERKGSKVWDQKILHKLCLLSSKLIKKYNILYTISRGKWTELIASITHWDKAIGRLIKHCFSQRENSKFQDHCKLRTLWSWD